MVPRDGKMRREGGTGKRDAGRGRHGDNDREVQSLNHSILPHSLRVRVLGGESFCFIRARDSCSTLTSS